MLQAEMDLYKGQCNCAYWHGVFGGLYLANLRHGIYEHLIKAENALQKLQRGDKKYTELLLSDFDKDGSEEVILSNPYLNLYFSPNHGGTLFELDYKPADFNLSNVLTRREEAYHKKIMDAKVQGTSASHGTQSIHDIVNIKEKDIDKFLIYDTCRRSSLRDRFFQLGTSLEELKGERYTELSDGVDSPYSFYPLRKGNEAQVSLSRNAQILGKHVKLTKTVLISSGQSIINIDYEIINLSDGSLEFAYGSEFNMTLLASDAPDRYIKVYGKERMNSEGTDNNINEYKLVDEWKGFSVSFESEKECELIRYPIETVSQSESGFERNYQGTCMVMVWNLALAPQKNWKNRVSIRLES
ncbi:DUF1926 domain-containing protein [Candidatus Saganbacteria bacterium]|nr:DUF1926 domain-containing protein [Candidatus Saganbacteria bacterium]